METDYKLRNIVYNDIVMEHGSKMANYGCPRSLTSNGEERSNSRLLQVWK